MSNLIKTLIVFALMMISNSSLAELRPLEAKLRVDRKESFSYYLEREDIGALHMKHPDVKGKEDHGAFIRNIFKGVKTNSALAEELKQWSDEGLQQLYAWASSGPMMSGYYNGLTNVDPEGIIKKLNDLVPKATEGTPRNAPPAASLFNGLTPDSTAKIAETLWRGKQVIQTPGKHVHVLLNRMSLPDPLAQSLLQGEVPHKSPTGEYMMMPAKIFCGESLLDTRKESIILDYAYSDDVPAYNGKRGVNTLHRRLVGREGLAIRDELRMIRPGIYLGRAYIRKAFLLWFVLSQDKPEKGTEITTDACRNPYAKQPWAIL